MATRPYRSQNAHLARKVRKARSAPFASKRHPDTYRGRNTASRPCGCRKTGKICPSCGELMSGPWWEGDASGDYRVWLCRSCGHRCERFAWELSHQAPTDPFTRPRPTRQ